MNSQAESRDVVAEPVRTVNLTELADLVGKSTNTMREIIRKHADFPVLRRGSNGVAYEFDADACAAWWRTHEKEVEQADEARRAEIDTYRLDLFGGNPEPEAKKGLTPTERLAELRAQALEDDLRRSRDQLLDRAKLLNELSIGIVELRNGMLQIPIEFARRSGLDREDRAALETMIERRLNDLADRLGRLQFFDAIDDAA